MLASVIRREAGTSFAGGEVRIGGASQSFAFQVFGVPRAVLPLQARAALKTAACVVQGVAEIADATRLDAQWSALRLRIGHVVGLGTSKEMRRVTARRIVAMVTGQQITEFGVGREFQRHAVRKKPSLGAIDATTDDEDAVAVSISEASPRPALIGASGLVYA